MSNLAKLRANALGHLTSRKFRYPVCLEPEKRAELRRLADLIRTTADAAAARAAELAARPDAEDAPPGAASGTARRPCRPWPRPPNARSSP